MRGVCHDIALNYIYLLLKVNSLWVCRYQRQGDQRGFNKLPTVLWNLNFHVIHFPWFLQFGLWAKKLTLKASMCSHIAILYSFNLLVCKPCISQCLNSCFSHFFPFLSFFLFDSFVQYVNFMLLMQQSFTMHVFHVYFILTVCICAQTQNITKSVGSSWKTSLCPNFWLWLFSLYVLTSTLLQIHFLVAVGNTYV